MTEAAETAPRSLDTPPTATVGGDGARAAHRCAGGRACRDPVVADDGTRTPAVIATAGGVCRRCRTAIFAAVDELPGDYRTLADAWQERRVGDRGDYVTGTPEPTIPINTTVEALQRALGEWADIALDMVTETLNIDHPEPYKGRGHPRRNHLIVAAARRIVGPNIDVLLAAPTQAAVLWNRAGTSWHVADVDGVGVALKLSWLHRQVVGALGDPNPRKRLAMPCPILDCGAETLGISNGTTDVTCATCGGRWTEREYAWLAGLLVADYTADNEGAGMLEWLLAEKTWQAEQLALTVATQMFTLKRVGLVANWTADDVGGASAMDVVNIVAEVLR